MKATTSVQTVAIQTEELDEEARRKANVYDKVDNTKRCELIRMLQQEEKTLKQASDLLGINYSTAKTIVQTFRREKRIAKKPKRFVETRKAIQKEKFLRKTLVKHRVAGIISRILEDEELFHSADEKCEDKKPVEPAEVSVTRPTNDVDINLPRPNKGIQRVCSAPQMVLIETEEEGPKEGQTSRAVGVREEMLLPANKKEIFYVYPENSLDEEYKSKVNYDDPVELRSKAKASGSTNESHESKQPLPSLWMVLPMPTFCQKTQPRPEVVRNDAFTIDFGAYRKSVMCNSFRKCVSMQFTGRTLLLPEQLTTAEEGSGFGRQPLKQW